MLRALGRFLSAVVLFLVRLAPPVLVAIFWDATADISDLIAQVRTAFGYEPEYQNLNSHAERIAFTLFAVGAVGTHSGLVRIGVWIRELHLLRLGLDISADVASVNIYRNNPVPASLRLTTRIRTPRTTLGIQVLNKLFGSSVIYLSWRYSQPGAFRLAGGPGVYKAISRKNLPVSHQRIPLRVARFERNHEIQQIFELQVSPDAAVPSLGAWDTAFHLRVAKEFSSPHDEQEAPRVIKHVLAMRLLLEKCIVTTIDCDGRQRLPIRIQE